MLDYNINLQSVLFMLHCPTKAFVSMYSPLGTGVLFKVMLIDNVPVNRYLIENFSDVAPSVAVCFLSALWHAHHVMDL